MAFTLHGLLEDAAARWPDRPALELGDRAITFAQLNARAQGVAAVLQSDRMERGERVAVLADRSFDSYAGIFGIMMAGGVYVPLNSAGPPAQHAAILDDTETSRIITDAAYADAAATLPVRLVVGGTIAPQAGRAVGLDEIVRNGGAARKLLRVVETDPCLIFFTSGSTGRPKGLVHSHRSMLANVAWAVERFGLAPTDRFANVTSHHFDLCWLEMYAPFACGGTIRIAPEKAVRYPPELSRCFAGAGINVWCSVPSVLMQLDGRGTLEQGDLAALRWVLFGGERFPTKNLKSLMRRWPQPSYCNMYGTSETHIAAYLPLPPAHELSDEPLPIGRGCEHVELVVFRPDGTQCDDGETGELAIRGPSLMEGYWRLPERTAAALRRHRVGDGVESLFYHTGDLAARREDGIHEIVGRADRRVKVSGVFVDLDEVEAVLLSDPAVRECAAFQAQPGHAIEAVAVAADGAATTGAALRAGVARHLAAQAVPQRIAIVADLPRTGSAKISRADIPAFFAAKAASPLTALGEGRCAALRSFVVEEVLPGEQPDLGDEDDLQVSGILQSLDVIRIVAFIEEDLGRPVPNEAFVLENFVSLGAMCRLLQQLDAGA